MRDAVQAIAAESATDIKRIGTITAGPGVTLRDREGMQWQPPSVGYEHFA